MQPPASALGAFICRHGARMSKSTVLADSSRLAQQAAFGVAANVAWQTPYSSSASCRSGSRTLEFVRQFVCAVGAGRAAAARQAATAAGVHHRLPRAGERKGVCLGRVRLQQDGMALA